MKAAEIKRRFNALESLRKTFDNTLQQIERYVVPYRGEFFRPMQTEHEVEWRRRNIYDATAPVAANLLASQMHGNLTPSSSRWYDTRFREEELNRDGAAKEWLEEATEISRQTLLESDFHNEASQVYLDLVSYGTACIMMEEESDIEWQGIDFESMPMVDCYFEMSQKGKPLRTYRRLRYTKLQMQDQFGTENLPEPFQVDEHQDVDRKYLVIFYVGYVEGWKDIDITKPLPPDLRPVEYKYILHDEVFELGRGGYYNMPAMIIRWNKVSGSRWGYSPAMVCLSDILTLNQLVAQTTEARAKAIDPPYVTTERGVVGDLDLSAGGLTVVSDMDDLKVLPNESQFDQAVEERQRLQAAIRSTFFIDKLELKDSPAMTATEVQVRYERMLRLMAPTLGRLQSDFLNPLIEKVFAILGRHGQLPKMPESIVGSEWDIEYTGPLPRAQQGETALGMETWLMNLSQVAEIYPNIRDIPDIDQWARTNAEMRGVPSKTLHTDEEVLAIRQARAEQEAERQEIERIGAAGEAMKSLGEGGEKVANIGAAA